MRGSYAVTRPNPPAPIECLQLPALVHSERVGRIAAIKTEDLRSLAIVCVAACTPFWAIAEPAVNSVSNSKSGKIEETHTFKENFIVAVC